MRSLALLLLLLLLLLLQLHCSRRGARRLAPSLTWETCSSSSAGPAVARTCPPCLCPWTTTWRGGCGQQREEQSRARTDSFNLQACCQAHTFRSACTAQQRHVQAHSTRSALVPLHLTHSRCTPSLSLLPSLDCSRSDVVSCARLRANLKRKHIAAAGEPAQVPSSKPACCRGERRRRREGASTNRAAGRSAGVASAGARG